MPPNTPPPDAQPTRRERRRREEAMVRAEWAAARRRRRLLWTGVGAALVVLVAIVIAGLVRSAQPLPGEVAQPLTAGSHVPEGSPIHWATGPPSSGQHYPTPAAWGAAATAIPPGAWVHNLEHGGIVMLYNPDAATPAVRQQLDQLVQQVPADPRFGERKLVVTPYPNLDHPIRVQAWGWTLPLDRVDAAAIVAFYRRHVDQGPEQVP